MTFIVQVVAAQPKLMNAISNNMGKSMVCCWTGLYQVAEAEEYTETNVQ